jgi:hypothetical protein
MQFRLVGVEQVAHQITQPFANRCRQIGYVGGSRSGHSDLNHDAAPSTLGRSSAASLIARSASIIMVVDPLTAGSQVDTSETQPFYNVTVAVYQQTAAILLRTGK